MHKKTIILRLSALAVLCCFLGLFVLTATHNHLQESPGGLGQECTICKILNSSAYYCVVALLQILPIFTALLLIILFHHPYTHCAITASYPRGPPADPFFFL